MLFVMAVLAAIGGAVIYKLSKSLEVVWGMAVAVVFWLASSVMFFVNAFI